MNLNILTVFQQAILAILMLLGNVAFVSILVVIIRRHFFKRKLSNLLGNSKLGLKVRNKTDDEEANCSSQGTSDHNSSGRFANEVLDDVISRSADKGTQSTRYDDTNICHRRKSVAQPTSNHDWKRSHHQKGLGFFPAPWQISSVRKAFRWLFRWMGEQPHESKHYYFSFVPSLDFKVGFSWLEKSAVPALKLSRVVFTP